MKLRLIVEYKAVTLTKGLIAHFKNVLEPILPKLSRIKDIRSIIRYINAAFEKQPFQDRRIVFNIPSKEDLVDPYPEAIIQGNVDPDNLIINLTPGKIFIEAIRNQDIGPILASVRTIIGHEDTHVQQFGNKDSKLSKNLTNEKHWKALEELVGENGAKFSSMMYDDPSSLDDQPAIRKMISQRYYINLSELPSHAYSAVAELVNSVKKEMPNARPQEVLQTTDKLIRTLKDDPTNKTVANASKAVKLYTQGVAKDFPKAVPSFIKMMGQTLRKLREEFF